MFGHDVDSLRALNENGYDPAALYESNQELKLVLDMIRSGYFAPQQPDLFAPIFDSLVRQGDYYRVLADYETYVACQADVDSAFQDHREWTRKSILNVANIGPFSIDRLVKEYAANVWSAKPVATDEAV